MQNLQNHKKFHVPHHFVFYPLALVVLGITAYQSMATKSLIWHIVMALVALMVFLSFMMRQHYALTLQNRLIRQEMRHKYFVLTGKDFEQIEKKLALNQIYALRFASDKELVDLIEKAIQNKLTPQQIKQSIVKWKADNLRV